MRLLDARTLELKTFVDNIPPYAILSHCWEDEEVVFSDLADLDVAKKKKGYGKIEKTCELALHDRLAYVWIDTCCIDKSSSAELSEVINSMFAWYKSSIQCFAYLADVDNDIAFADITDPRYERTFPNSRWFTRAWTLQELLATSRIYPVIYEGMKFYSSNWKLLGNKTSLSL
jgi:hypothetical protein